MIRNFGNLAAFEIYKVGQTKSVPDIYHFRAQIILQVMMYAETIEEVQLALGKPSLRPHSLKYDRAGEIALDIVGSKNPWRITYRYDGEFYNVKVENYHKE